MMPVPQGHALSALSFFLIHRAGLIQRLNLNPLVLARCVAGVGSCTPGMSMMIAIVRCRAACTHMQLAGGLSEAVRTRRTTQADCIVQSVLVISAEAAICICMSLELSK